MSTHLASELNARIEPTSMLLKSFGGHQLDTVGTCVLPTRVKGAKDSIPLEYYVIKDNVWPLLGLESCLALELITLNGKVEQIGLKRDLTNWRLSHDDAVGLRDGLTAHAYLGNCPRRAKVDAVVDNDSPAS